MRVNLNSVKPQIIISLSLVAVQRFDDTPNNRLLAIESARRIWNFRAVPVQVEAWEAGHGQLIFKRTAGDCVG